MKKMLKVVPVLMLLSSSLFAITGLDVAKAHDEKKKPSSTHLALKMDLIEASGKTSSRTIEQWAIDSDQITSNIMVFRAPACVKNTRFLQVTNEDRGDDKWIYLPALKRVRRIASSDGAKPFMGSDVSYDDMESRDLERDTHEFVKEEKWRDWDCYVVKGQAVDPEDSQYAYRLTWFEKNSYTPVKIEMYDKSGELLKLLDVKVLEERDGYTTPIDTVITNVQTGHSTNMTILQSQYDSRINPKMFTTQFLKNGR